MGPRRTLSAMAQMDMSPNLNKFDAAELGGVLSTAAPAQNERESMDGQPSSDCCHWRSQQCRQTGHGPISEQAPWPSCQYVVDHSKSCSDHAYNVSRTYKTNGSADRVQAIGASVGIRMTTKEATIRSDKVMAHSDQISLVGNYSLQRTKWT